MRNRTSALSRAEACRGLKLRAICRTMLLRYPGNGNSIPSLRTVATSVPLPPVGPPPAFGASGFASVLTLVFVGAVTLVELAFFPSVGVAAFAVVFTAPVLVRVVAAVVRLRVGTGASRI